MSHLDYIYKHEQTLATTGYFSCEPQGNFALADELRLLLEQPLDTFWHRYLLGQFRSKSMADLLELLNLAYDAKTKTYTHEPLAALILECASLFEKFAPLKDFFPEDAAKKLAYKTPLIYLRKSPHNLWHNYLLEVFQGSILRHTQIPPDFATNLEALGASTDFEDCLAHLATYSGTLAKLHASAKSALAEKADKEAPAEERLSAQALYRLASDLLWEAGILEGQEMRHEASLSPIALLREFKIDLAVKDGPVDYILRGKARAYGRGFSLLQARISCIMEIIERASIYVSVDNIDGEKYVAGRKNPLKIYQGRPEDLAKLGLEVLPLNVLPLEVEPLDLPLNYVTACDPLGQQVLVPAQAVFLFANFNEPELFMAQGSTGIASGQTLAEAKIHALCEILERDAEATMPFNPKHCFRLQSRDPKIQGLLDDYAKRSIHIQFQDLTWELGVPIYQCFVTKTSGEIVKASACNLLGSKACLSALTETPWPYSLTHEVGEASAALNEDLPVRYLEDLPDFTLGNPEAELKLLEDLLIKCGYRPLYVDVTRQDLELPVVRAIIPHLQLTPELDSFSNFDPRLVARSWALAKAGQEAGQKEKAEQF